MENKLEVKLDQDSAFKDLSSVPSKQKESEKTNSKIKSISLFGDQFVIMDEHLPGVYCEGIQYYDLKNIRFINNTGMANLIELLKSLLQKGVEVQFVNVNEKIKNKIKLMGLDHILNCI